MKLYSRSALRALLILSTALGATTAFADGIADKVTVTDPYIRAVPPVAKTSAAFMQLESSDTTERFVVGASTPAAGVAELHMHTMDDGVMRMRHIPHIHLPPNKKVKLEPGGLHVMLFDLTAPLKVGDKIPLTLEFEDGSTKEVTAEVRPITGMMNH